MAHKKNVPCKYCDRLFMSEPHLETHIVFKHLEQWITDKSVDKPDLNWEINQYETVGVIALSQFNSQPPALPADDDLIDEPIPYTPATYEIDVRISDIERGKPSSELLDDDE